MGIFYWNGSWVRYIGYVWEVCFFLGGGINVGLIFGSGSWWDGRWRIMCLNRSNGVRGVCFVVVVDCRICVLVYWWGMYGKVCFWRIRGSGDEKGVDRLWFVCGEEWVEND